MLLNEMLEKRAKADEMDNSFMRNYPFPWAAFSLGVSVVFVYYLAVTRLPQEYKSYVPIINVVFVSLGFFLLVRSLAIGGGR